MPRGQFNITITSFKDTPLFSNKKIPTNIPCLSLISTDKYSEGDFIPTFDKFTCLTRDGVEQLKEIFNMLSESDHTVCYNDEYVFVSYKPSSDKFYISREDRPKNKEDCIILDKSKIIDRMDESLKALNDLKYNKINNYLAVREGHEQDRSLKNNELEGHKVLSFNVPRNYRHGKGFQCLRMEDIASLYYHIIDIKDNSISSTRTNLDIDVSIRSSDPCISCYSDGCNIKVGDKICLCQECFYDLEKILTQNKAFTNRITIDLL